MIPCRAHQLGRYGPSIGKVIAVILHPTVDKAVERATAQNLPAPGRIRLEHLQSGRFCCTEQKVPCTKLSWQQYDRPPKSVRNSMQSQYKLHNAWNYYPSSPTAEPSAWG
eukprot:5561261-Pleurochrysis_carterae.AAC.3